MPDRLPDFTDVCQSERAGRAATRTDSLAMIGAAMIYLIGTIAFDDLVLAENVVRAGQAAWWYSLRMPLSRCCRRTSSLVIAA